MGKPREEKNFFRDQNHQIVHLFFVLKLNSTKKKLVTYLPQLLSFIVPNLMVYTKTVQFRMIESFHIKIRDNLLDHNLVITLDS